MGVTSDTPANLVVGAGEANVDGADMGATIGANLFRIDRTMFTPTLNGVKGELVGTTYIQKSEGIMECSVPELGATVLALGWPGSREAGGTIDEDDTRRLPLTEYHNWELVVPGLTTTFRFQVDNAINRADISVNLADDAAAAPRYELHSGWDPADLANSPHRIVVG